jgi:hypothetical protein
MSPSGFNNGLSLEGQREPPHHAKVLFGGGVLEVVLTPLIRKLGHTDLARGLRHTLF